MNSAYTALIDVRKKVGMSGRRQFRLQHYKSGIVMQNVSHTNFAVGCCSGLSELVWVDAVEGLKLVVQTQGVYSVILFQSGTLLRD
jgi:hypothetical protein